ncbi:hypothetical protein EHM69_07690 [candidate division KSB1 bacterium]|nr:MAG: hypothetical protein EHM69_07690 [candidate division KSB1 bacterium]
MWPAAICYAQGTQANPSFKLDSLRRELDRIDRKLESGESREKNVLRDIDASEQRIAIAEELVREQRQQVAGLRDSISRLERQIGPRENELVALGTRILELEDNQNRLSAALARSMLAEHRLRGWTTWEFLLEARSWRELLARRTALKRLQNTVRETKTGLNTAVGTLHETEDTVFLSTQALRERKWSLENSRRRAVEIETDMRADLQKLAIQKNALQIRLKKLRQDRRMLEAHRQEIAASQAQIEEMIGRIAGGQPLSGAPFNLLKGMLPWPVRGRIVEKFGLIRNPRLATITENPGIEISSSPNASVISVADGRVSSVSWLRGFGNVCIIEHAGSFYTVYAKLGQVVVKMNDEVKAGNVLGYPGFNAAADDYRVHFELWSGKEKKNPVEWLLPQ